MRITGDLAEVLADVRVLELATLGRDSGPRLRPMAGVWEPESQRIIITTPLAYAQKAREIRRDNRVAVLFSDFTGTGLSGRGPVLVQGVAEAPDVVAAPQDLPEYWRELFRRTPGMAEEFASAEARAAMDWYYLRLPLYVTPQRVHELEPVVAGGADEPYPPQGAALSEQVKDALARYPSAVFAAADEQGHPYAIRALISDGESDGSLRVRPAGRFTGPGGPAGLLWHRHDGTPAGMLSLSVNGPASGAGTDWRLRPERIPGASVETPDSEEAWVADGRRRTDDYLRRSGHSAPAIDWDALSALRPA